MDETAFSKRSVTEGSAGRVVVAAVARALAIGSPSSVAVVDESGNLKAFARMDGAPLPSIQIAQDKAYTAVGFGMPTTAWAGYLEHDRVLAVGLANVGRMVVFGGGVPLVVDGEIIGAVGVSGGHYDQDHEIAQAAADALAAETG